MIDRLNFWTMDVVYLDKGKIHRKDRIQSTTLHAWLKKRGYKIKYDYQHGAWTVSAILTEDEINELKKLKTIEKKI